MPPESSTTRVIAERYELRSELGRGGMGVVWNAYDTLLDRTVAIKEVHLPDALAESQHAFMQARALREARAAGRLNHPGAVTVFDVRQQDGRAYIIMELVDSPTLSHVVGTEGPLEPARVAEVGIQLARTLQSAHELGIVHRDVKPDNVMVSADGRVKLADFGIASLKDDPKITTTGLVLGSPAYMAPEQAQGLDAGPEIDLWATGATMYFAVEGEPPFDKGGPIPTLTAVLGDEPRPFRRAEALAPIIEALLGKDPAARPSESKLIGMLEDMAAARPIARPTASEGAPAVRREAVPAAQPVPDRAGPVAGAAHSEPAPVRRGRRRMAPLVALALVVLVATAAVVYAINRQGAGRADADRPASTGASGAGASGEPADGEATPGTEQDSSPGGGDSSGAGDAIPEGWTAYEDPEIGYRVAYPRGWNVIRQSNSETTTDFGDPETGTYLRVDWTDTPGSSPEGAWEESSSIFAGNHTDYQEIRIDPLEYKGLEAAAWEYTYTDGGAALHAVNLGFVTGEYGLALNFQTHEEDWSGAQGLFRRLKLTFAAPDQ